MIRPQLPRLIAWLAKLVGNVILKARLVSPAYFNGIGILTLRGQTLLRSGKQVGTVMLLKESKWWHLNHLMINEANRGQQGLAKMFLEQICKAADRRDMPVSVRPVDYLGADNLMRLFGLYQSYGFARAVAQAAAVGIQESFVRWPQARDEKNDHRKITGANAGAPGIRGRLKSTSPPASRSSDVEPRHAPPHYDDHEHPRRPTPR